MISTGDRLADRFEVERLAERGGMGSVFRARDLRTNKTVALKVMHPHAMTEADRMVREARVLQRLRHPGIVEYVDHGTAADGLPYIAMEWIEGEDLRRRLQRQGLRWPEAVAMARSVAEALHHAHGRGVVHRDVKPSNLLLVGGATSLPKVVDFGVARITDPTGATGAGALLGTAAYMSPEQARGDVEISPAADVFSLGSVLFECVAGRRAFLGQDVMAVLAKVLLAEAPRLRSIAPSLPRALDRLVARMLSKDPAVRPSAIEIAHELDELLSTSGDSIDAGEPGGALLQSLAPPSLTSGEKKLASVLFVRPRVDSTVRSNTRDVDRVATTRSEPIAWNRMRTVLQAFEARLEQLADGSMLVVVAGQGNARDQAVVAAQCALALRAELPEAAMGLATGSGEVSGGTWVGEAIDRAAHLTRQAQHGSTGVWVDEVTASLVEEVALVRRDGPLVEIVAVKRGEIAVRTLLGRPSPFVGRFRELALLQSTLAEAMGESVARGVVVVAPAGSGKTRLCHELIARVPPGTELWLMAGDPITVRSPFGMLAQVVRRVADLHDNEPEDRRWNKVYSAVRALMDDASAARVAAFVGEAAGAPAPEGIDPRLRAARLDPVMMGDQIRKAWEDLACAACRAKPLLVVIEDLHWADGPTVKLFDHLLKQRRDLPLFVLALARPGVRDAMGPIFRGSNVVELALPDLSRKSAERLVREALGSSATEAIVTRAVEHAGGSPFVLEELIRAHAEGRGGDMPHTVLAMVRARIEALEASARKLLRAASVFGSSFWRAAVERLIGAPPGAADVGAWIQELIEREILVRVDRSRFAGEEELAFRHALLRDAAYAMLTDSDRATGHALAGAWLESAGERDAAVLAIHFERGGQTERAIRHYEEAARQSLEGNELSAALGWIEKGLSCGASGEARGALRLMEAEVFRWRGEAHREQNAAIDAMELLPRGDLRWCIAAGQVAIASGKLGDRDRMEAVARELLSRSVVDVVGDERGAADRLVIAAARASIPLALAGLSASAEALLRHAERPEGGADPGVAAWVLLAKGTHAAEQGEIGIARDHMRASAAKFEEAGDVRAACSQCTNIAWTSLDVGDVEGAERALTTGVEQATTLGLHHIVSNAKIYLGQAALRRGRVEEAKRLLREAVSAFRTGANHRMEAVARRSLAEALLAGGDTENAEIEANSALNLADKMPPTRAYALATCAEIAIRQGRTDKALEAAREAMSLLEQLGKMVQGEACVRRVWAEALRSAGRIDEASEAARDARARLAEKASRFTNSEDRRRFFENVPDHAATVAPTEAVGTAP